MADVNFFHYSDSVMYCSHLSKDMSQRLAYGLHSHDVYELIFIKGGNVDYFTASGEYRLSRGDLVITRPYEAHSLIPRGSIPYERYNLLIDEQMLGFPFKDGLPDGDAPINLLGNKAFSSLFDKFDFYYANLSGDSRKVAFHALAKEICLNILIELADKIQPAENANEIINDALEYIDDNLMQISSVEEISNALFITKSHLHHLFSKKLNKTPKRYVTERRLALAKNELSNGARPSKIYSKYGFSDYSSFFRAYKSCFGVSPTVKSTPERTSVTPESTIILAEE